MNCCNDYGGKFDWSILIVSLLFGFIAGLSIFFAATQKATCIDGDTFKLMGITYRLSNVDTPEKGEKNYTKASEYTCNFLDHKFFTLNKHGEDKYGRTLTEVKSRDNKDLGYLLVENCLAEPFWTNTTDEIINAYKNNCQ